MTQFMDALSLELGKSGSTVTLTGIIYIATRMVGEGPNGDHVSFQFTPNYIPATGEYHHGKHWEILVGLDENSYTALFNTDVDVAGGGHYAFEQEDENFAIEIFKIKVSDTSGELYWVWTPSTTFGANISQRIDNMNQGPNSVQPYEVKFVSKGIMGIEPIISIILWLVSAVNLCASEIFPITLPLSSSVTLSLLFIDLVMTGFSSATNLCQQEFYIPIIQPSSVVVLSQAPT